MKILMSRRDALKNLALGAGSLLAVGATAGAAADAGKAAAYANLPHVTPTDQVAVALSYHEDAKTVEAAKFPTYKPEQHCGNCLQLGGNDGDPWRPCNLFPGKLVNAGGWCKVYVKKP
jgi:High potential iron-sulfur protein